MLGFLKDKKRLKNNNSLDCLTPKELEVFKILLNGYTMKETSKLLKVKYSTINSHTKSIYKKLNVNSRCQLILRFHENIESEEVKI